MIFFGILFAIDALAALVALVFFVWGLADGSVSERNIRQWLLLLGGFARHANFSHVIMLGLGGEVNQIGGIMEEQKLAGRLRGMDIQTMGGTRKTVSADVDFVKKVLAEANAVTRVPVPAGEITLALQCGGSDGLSGSSAKPAPANKAGGLTTILEKSLGAMAKAGSTNLVDVVGYAEAIAKKGFVFMDTPGYDSVAATGQVAGGANLTCFTTGRGSVFGGKPAPSIKLATNTPMYTRMADDMDVNCGTIPDGDETVQQCGERIFDLILRVASGEKTASEKFDFGAAEFAPWVIGATM